MICTTSSLRAYALLALLAATAVHAQGNNNNNNNNNLPDLATATQTPGLTQTTSEGTSSSTSATNDASTTATSETAATTSPTGNAFTATFPDATTTSSSGGSSVIFTFSNVPTIAGAGIPSMVVPYTADAPFMQKSDLPEGTVFIAVGAVLAFLGACVLIWRGLIAWSINRSVKRNSRAAMGLGGSEKPTGWGRGGGGPVGSGGKAAYYKEYEMGSTMSLDALNSNGKATRQPTFHEEGKRQSSAPPAGLFFSPTAQASSRVSSVNLENRGSSYLPAGYYASPNSEAAGGRGSTVIGSNLAPYARNSAAMPSPPGSPVPGSRNTSNNYAALNNPYMSSRDGFRNTSREGLRAPPSRDGYSSQRNSSVLYNQASSSSLMVGTGAGAQGSNEYLGGQRAPSAVLDELFENHGNGPRERF